MVLKTQIILFAVFEPTNFKFLKHAVQNSEVRMIIRLFFILKWNNPGYSATQDVLMTREKYNGMIRHAEHVFSEIDVGKKAIQGPVA